MKKTELLTRIDGIEKQLQDLKIEAAKLKSEYKAKVWYRHSAGALKFYAGNNNSYGFNSGGTWIDEHKFNPNFNWTEANESEVKEALLREATARGFVEGAKFYGLEGVQKDELIVIGKNSDISTFQINIGLHCENSWLLFKGKWADVLKEPEGMFVNIYHSDGIVHQNASIIFFGKDSAIKAGKNSREYKGTYQLIEVK